MKKIVYTVASLALIGAFVFVFKEKLDTLSFTARSKIGTQLAAVNSIDFKGESKIKQLENEIKNLSFAKINILSLQQENKELKSLLGYKDSDKVYLARVLNQTQEPKASILDLYVYSKNLPENKKMLAISPQGFALGFVSNSKNKNFAKLELFSKPKNKILVTLLFEDKDAPSKKLSTDALGYTPGSFELYVNKEYPVKVGDVIFYKTYPIAQIIDIEKDKQSPFVKVWAALPFDLSTLDFVLIKEI